MSTEKLILTPNTKIGVLVKEYPYLKEYLLSLSPHFENLNNPLVFKTMANIATLKMISANGNFNVEDLIGKLVDKIKEQSR